MKLLTPLSELTTKDLRDLCKFGMEYCEVVLGKPKRKLPLTYSVLTNKNTNKYWISQGEYDPTKNKISVFKNNIPNVRKFLEVFIHEYTHSLQPIEKKYNKLLDKFGYNDHPYEIQANENGEKHYRKLWDLYKLKTR
jgi:hypothetical protein